jgi:hypothetical protein
VASGIILYVNCPPVSHPIDGAATFKTDKSEKLRIYGVVTVYSFLNATWLVVPEFNGKNSLRMNSLV